MKKKPASQHVYSTCIIIKRTVPLYLLIIMWISSEIEQLNTMDRLIKITFSEYCKYHSGRNRALNFRSNHDLVFITKQSQFTESFSWVCLYGQSDKSNNLLPLIMNIGLGLENPIGGQVSC